MAVELQNVRKRIASTRQIQKVTSAMQRVASARLVNDRRAMESSSLYTGFLRNVLQGVWRATATVEHDLLQPRSQGRPALIVFGSDRGLCGGFNTALMDAVREFVTRPETAGAALITVGRVVERRARRSGQAVSRAFRQPARDRREELIDTLAALAVDGFRGGVFREVSILYSRFLSGLVQAPTVERLLPVPFAPDGGEPLDAAILEPSGPAILDRLLPELVSQALDHGFLNSVASENAARQMAMSRATDNAGEMLDGLLGTYRRLRQEHITTEMLELVGGGMMGDRD